MSAVELIRSTSNVGWLPYLVAIPVVLAALAVLCLKARRYVPWGLFKVVGIVLGGSGLLVFAANLDRSLALQASDVGHMYLKADAQRVQQILRSPSVHCSAGIRTSTSPSDFDTIEAKRESLCEYMTAYGEKLANWNWEHLGPLPQLGIDRVEFEGYEPLLQSISRTQGEIEDYNRRVAIVARADADADLSGSVFWMVFALPLAALGFGINLAVALFEKSLWSEANPRSKKTNYCAPTRGTS